jgi:7,8-dihydroneopterin aldolase/epimerase/oxygenase
MCAILLPMNTISSCCKLTLTDLRYPVRLGVSQMEQATPQMISLTMQLGFVEVPRATQTDQLTDTFCYFALSQAFQDFIRLNEPFHLIEYLGGGLYACAYEYLLNQSASSVMLEMAVKKLTPPVPGLYGGVTFCYNGLVQQGIADDLHQHWF